MLINEIEDLAFENYYKRIGFSIKISYNSRKRLNKKDLLLLANKLIKNKSDLHNAKELSIIYNKEKLKISKTIRNNYLSTKNF